jgi:hypothetical protein
MKELDKALSAELAVIIVLVSVLAYTDSMSTRGIVFFVAAWMAVRISAVVGARWLRSRREGASSASR